MRLVTKPRWIFLAAFVVSARGFSVFDSRQPTAAVTKRASPRLRMSEEPNSEVAALLAAAAKARAEADRLRQELGQSSAAKSGSTASPTAAAATLMKKSPSEVSRQVQALVSDANPEEWQALRDQSRAFGSASLRTYPVSLRMLEERSGLTPASLGLDADSSGVNLDDFKYATLYVTGGSAVAGVAALALLPPNVGATVCYLVALVPILFLAVGSTAPQVIANAIVSLREGESGGGVSQIDRVCRHEAAHFCCGYWCGLAITGYSTADPAGPRVEFGVAPSERRGYSATQVAALAVTSLGGSVGEALGFGTASGAAQDLMALQQIFQRASDFYGAAAQQDVTRWAALAAAQLLRQNSAKYEQVVQALQRQASVEECVEILES